MQDFLLELGFEELPARFVQGAVEQISEGVTQRLDQAGLSYGQVESFSTPRRIALLIRDLQTQQEDSVEEIKGPPLNIARDSQGQLTKAGRGFLRSQGVDESAITIKPFQGADYMYINKEVKGQKTKDLLKPLLEDVITRLSFPKNMRWGNLDLRYARPLRWILALLGREVVPVQIGPIQAGPISWGHRQLSSGPITIGTPGEYPATLKEHYVMADAAKRQVVTWEQIQALADKQGAEVFKDQRLLEEVVNLVEYPTAFCGSFSQEYLKVPAEVLVTSMKEHQRYFPLQDSSGELKPLFIGVRNGADNHLDNVILGNEKVLEARLSDAKFFYDEDVQTNLAGNIEKLERVVFQEKLGSMGDKVRRMERLTGKLIDQLGHPERKETALRTAHLAKCDLVSQMVYEFPELQGIMGEKYALAQGEDELVAKGIREHYQPRFSGDLLPTTVGGTVVSLADKLDTLVGYFALGKIPTGSQDPFALRRQAQGVVQILMQGGYDLSLQSLITEAAAGYQEVDLSQENSRALVEFFLARLRVLLTDQGYAYDIIDAVMASQDDHICSLVRKVEALAQFSADKSYGDLITGFERVANLAAAGEPEGLDPSIFHAADQVFHQALGGLERVCQGHLAKQDYVGILQALAEFRQHVDAFFAGVMIMDEDLAVRANRLALLNQALRLYILCGDLRLIVGSR